MSISVLLPVLLVLTVVGFYMGRSRAVGQAGGNAHRLHSRPNYYGYYVAIWCGVPSILLVAVWISMQGSIVDSIVMGALPASLTDGLDRAQLQLLLNDIQNLADASVVSREVGPELLAAADHYAGLKSTASLSMFAVALAAGIAGLTFARSLINPEMRARTRVERSISVVLIICSTIAVLTTLGIVLSLLFETIRFFDKVSPAEFLFSLQWSPQTALRDDQVGASGAFGALPLLLGTMLISFIAMLVAAPVGLMSAVYLAEYAPPKIRAFAKPALEVLAGIPTVVYGFFAALTVAPFLRELGVDIGLDISSESALAAGGVMGIMIIPFVSSLSDDVINAVPQSLRDGSYGLGATKSETIVKVILPAALPGIVGSLLLAVSRAIGETMIVVMAAGLAANLTVNPLQAVTTVTVQIVTLLVGDQEFDSAKTLAAFALGLLLFCVTLVLNVIALMVVNKYREQYD
ncbi:MAG: phosphate ABC transporter permease subunit PstC [Rhodospirillales bacterium]